MAHYCRISRAFIANVDVVETSQSTQFLFSVIDQEAGQEERIARIAEYWVPKAKEEM